MIYDDRISSERRIRWTIAHELGHILLGHFVEFTLTSLLRGVGDREYIGLTDEEYGILEVEAHYFAAAFLSPSTVIRKIDNCKTASGIIEICDISDDAACRRFDELKRLPYGSYEIEELLNRNFYDYIRKANNPNFVKFTPPLDFLPLEYEDFVEYEYWDYIVALLGKNKKYAELSIGLAESIAIYEDDSMLIVTKTDDIKSLADKHKEIIINALEIHGKTRIRNISLFSMEILVLLR